MRSQSQALRPAALLKGVLLLWFMVLTSFAVVHNAEHGFHKHYHYGKECPVFDFCEHQSLGTGLPTIPHVFLPALPFPPAVGQLFSLTTIQPVVAAPARAPPVLS